jgi:hypothetical protein
MDHLHWRMLRDNASDSDMYCTCLGHLGHSDINRNNPICVASPKVAMASTMVTVAVAGVIMQLSPM